MSKIKVIAFHYTDEQLFQSALKIRTKVFVEEQNVDKAIEFDGFDADARHYIACIGEEPAGTARYRHVADGIKLERFAVSKAMRGRGIGEALVKAVLGDVLPFNKRIFLHAQEPVIGFYQKFGFQTIGKRFYEANIPHLTMIYQDNSK